MFKWVSWVIRMGATALLLSFLCIWTTGYIVNSYMESIVKQLGLPIEIQPIALSGVWGTLWGADQTPKVEAAASKDPDDEIPASASTDASKDLSSHQHSEEKDTPEAAINSDEPNTDADASPSPNSTPSPSIDDPAVDLEAGAEDAPVFNGEAGMSQLSEEERQALYTMVMSKLNQNQLNQLSVALKDGLTSEELTQLQSMLQTALTNEEYSQMLGLLQGMEKTDSSAVSE